MKLIATVRDRATITTEASAPDVAALRAAVLASTPPGHALAGLHGGGRVNGDLVGTAVFRPTATRTIEAEGRDYPSARKALEALVPEEQVVLSVHAIDGD